MKIWIPTNPLWYAAMSIFFGPFFFEAFFGPSWIIKLISISALNIGIFALLFFFALTDKFSSVMEETPFVKKWGEQRVLAGIRVFFLICALIFSLNAINLAKDIGKIIFGSAPVTLTDTVKQKYNGTALGSVFISTIRFDNEPSKPEGSFDGWFFPSRYLKIGEAYEFLYLPNTHIILEASPIRE